MHSFDILTQGNTSVDNITDHVKTAVTASGVRTGVVTVYLPSTTAALLIIEDEPGHIADVRAVLNQLVPEDGDFAHNAKWKDTNAFAQVRAALLQPSLSIPVQDAEPLLGSWQHVMLIDFDTQQRTRTVHVHVQG